MSKSSWFHVWVPSKFKEKNTHPVLSTKFDVKPVFENGGDKQDILTPVVESSSFEESIVEYLEQILKLTRFIRLPSNDGEYQLFLFRVGNESVEKIMLELTNRGIGLDGSDTSVSVLSDLVTLGPSECHLSLAEEERFYSTVKSRLMVTEVISRIRAGGSFTFDYLMLVILAGILAFLGLLEDSSVILVASMLVSPIMGPILSGIFGCVIRDYQLTMKGIVNELVSLLICICIGFILGFLTSALVSNNIYQSSDWPTSEMISRGNTRGLVTGILVAIPSGAGVALSVLGGNAGSLVGVAISASLLPPAVNAGVFWGMSFIAVLSGGSVIRGFDGITYDESMNCDWGPSPNTTNPYKLTYGCSVAFDTFVLGSVSLSLTILNIVCIIFTGFAVLSIKEVTPDKIPQNFPDFWKKDIKVHRNYYKTLKKNEIHDMKIQKSPEDGSPCETSDLADTFMHRIFEQAHQDEDYLDITRWVAFPRAPPTSAKRNSMAESFSRNRAYTSMRMFSFKELKRQFSN